MKNGFIKSSPHFFTLIGRSMFCLVAFVLMLAIEIPAPLQEQANPARTPNPAKSAWFLLWVQELVSWSRLMIVPVIVLFILFVLLPWLPGTSHIHKARWFPSELRTINMITVILVVVIMGLTIMAQFFRGADWALVF